MRGCIQVDTRVDYIQVGTREMKMAITRCL